jgi:transcriptional regulator with XRE-family HTH domain
MGRSPTAKPRHLAKKLQQIRTSLGLSQSEMARRLSVKLSREDVSKYERGVRVAPLLTLLRYARLASVSMDVLVDDQMKLPERFHSKN